MTSARNIFFIDARVADAQTLIDHLPAGSEWFMIDADQDGLAQMQAALAAHDGDLDSIQILSHGASGALLLGSTVLDHDTLSTYRSQLGSIGSHLTESGDLLLYGCNVAQGESGQRFVEKIAQMTGADVAASEDITGGQSNNGN
ncbi:DUF4347 domain-containing protein [Allochromatium vinosum]|uniref:Lipase, class 3 n=1 Tax=Allochromatium vinosum (strain ATCC 17899 / DSM 180 / NBRC 103801 / NCIMB 10441 / D) TaxID=572477 RepID=D3RRC2_ALLVD|nr:DUF4347 domain-containing protein [Allochromatium vinosum]ADC63834.1 lipase, class 3 [Allochromatium vinosum DSM 180]